MVYEITCLDCKSKGKRARYVGESHRSYWDRSLEHLADLRTKNDKNSLVKHWQECHGEQDVPPKYSFNVLKKCRTSLQRQIWEAILIDKEHSQCDYEINQKGEFGINLMPKLMPTMNGELAPENKPDESSRKRPPKPDVSNYKSNFSTQYSQRRKRAKLDGHKTDWNEHSTVLE